MYTLQKYPYVLHNLHIRYLNILDTFTKWLIEFNDSVTSNICVAP